MLYHVASLFVKQKNILFIESKYSNKYQNIPVVRDYCTQKKMDHIDTLRQHTFFLTGIFKIAKAKLIIIDQSNYLLSRIKLKKQIKVLQLWHGGGLLKKVGYDKSQIKDVKEKRRLKRVYQNISDVIVCDEKLKAAYARMFNVSVEHVHATGIPRTDRLYEIANSCQNKRTDIRRTVLVAFSYKEFGKKRQMADFDIERLKKELGNNFDVIVREHPTIENNIIIQNNKPLETDLSNADMLITDWSSILFEFAIISRPIIFYDAEKLDQAKMYVDRSKLGDVAHNITELKNMILTAPEFSAKSAKIWDEYMSACDGHATQRVYELIKRLL